MKPTNPARRQPNSRPTDRRRWTLVAALLATVGTGACIEAEEPGEDEVGTREQSLNGTWAHSPILQNGEQFCTGQERWQMNAAFEFIDERLSSAEFRDCVVAASMEYENFDMIPEDTIALLRLRSTTYGCKNTNAYSALAGVPTLPEGAQPDGSHPEHMTLSTQYLANWPQTADLAGVIVHEAAHSLGFNHPGGGLAYNFSPPQQLRFCMAELIPEGRGRDVPDGDTELAAVGGSGGAPFDLRCPAGARVTQITADTAPGRVNRMRLRCSDGSDLGTVGTYANSTSSITATCQSGYSLSKVLTISNSTINGMLSYCASDADLASDDATPATRATWLGGGFAGTWAKRSCPTGMAIVGAHGRSGSRVDQIRWICQDIDGDLRANPVQGPGGVHRGAKWGRSQLGMCSGNGVINALYGITNGEVMNVGALCDRTEINPQTNLPRLPASLDASRHIIREHGGRGLNGEPAFADTCPNDWVMVGLQTRSGGRIDAIGGLCAPMDTWAAGQTTPSWGTPLRGGNTGNYSTVFCPAKQFLVGIKTWAANTPEQGNVETVHGFELRCRDLSPL